MPIIATTCIGTKGVSAIIVYCTEEEYAKYKKTKVIPENCIPLSFIAEKVALKGYAIKGRAEDISVGLALTGENYIFESGFDRFVTVEKTKAILNEAGIKYEDFIDEYAKRLKSL